MARDEITPEIRDGLHRLLDHALDLIQDFDPDLGNGCPEGKDAAMREALQALNEIAAYWTPAIKHVFHIAADPHTFPSTSNADDHRWEQMESLGPENVSSNRDGCAAVLTAAPNILPDKLAYVVADALIGASMGEQAPLITPESKGSSKRNDQRWRDHLRTDLGRFMWLLIGLSGLPCGKGGLAAARSECAMLFDIDVRTIRSASDRVGWEKEITQLESTLAEQAGTALAGADWTDDARQWWDHWSVGLGGDTVESVAKIMSDRYTNLIKKSDNLNITIEDKIKERSLELIRGR